jgi:hypothetical protein
MGEGICRNDAPARFGVALVSSYQIHDDFSPYALRLRRHFDREFRDPLQGHAGRFVWDYWHVPGEYTNLRTPAFHYFPRPLYEKFHRHLVEWGRLHLGCHDISPPWLSCYLTGCRQERHVDRPHGPLAFVFSLTNWEARVFRGGETFLPKKRIAPEFNRLTVFNPSLPHGVREVRGTNDPREGRLVIHGWFVNPRPFWAGPLTAEQVGESLDHGLGAVVGGLELGEGLISLRLSITPAGRVRTVKPLINTLVGARHVRTLEKRLANLHFPRRRSGTRLTLPLICSNS